METTKDYSRRRIAYVVDTVSQHLGTVRLPGLTPELVPLAEVCGAYVRGCLEAARGVSVLGAANEYGGIVAAERSAWEIWNEIDYLLSSADPPRNAVKVQANALLDVSELLRDQEAPAEMLEKNQGALATFETCNADVVAEVRRQREKGKRHWSGQSRTSVVGGDGASKAVYKMLSWETHPDILSIIDIHVEIRDGVGHLQLHESVDVNTNIERSASSTSECLLRTWNAFAHSFGQPTIKDAPPRRAA